jgi:succinate dehydrogenase/fumarate reductase flavoprotein subunit
MLRSLLLADDGEIAEALEELEKADDAAIAVGSRELLTSVHGRRAYVMAADGRPAEEVAGQLEETFEYGETYLPTELALERTLEALEEIRSRFPEAYGDALSKLKRRLKSGEVRAAREAAAMAASQAQAAEDAPAAGTDPDTAHTSEPAE